MQLIKSTLDNVSRLFDMATLSGVYALPFLAAVAYLLLAGNEKNKKAIKLLLVPCAVAIILLFSPLIGLAAGSVNNYTRMLRFYWTIPFDIVVLYAAVDILFKLKTPLKKGTFVAAVCLGLLCFSRQQNMTYPKVEQKWPWVKAENLYKVPQSVYELCNMIQAEQQGKECRAAFPFELAMCVRQYDASIYMAYGEAWPESDNACFDAINADAINLNDVEQAALDEDLDYIVLEQSKIDSGAMSAYTEIGEVSDEAETYVLYQKC